MVWCLRFKILLAARILLICVGVAFGRLFFLVGRELKLKTGSVLVVHWMNSIAPGSSRVPF